MAEENTLSRNAEQDAGMDNFLQRSRSELMYELRRIQHGDRPVTGQGHRESIQQFFEKRMMEPAGSAGKDNVPANVDSVDEHRPESVVVEVQGLFEQRRVSSILQSQSFRRSLESIIRGSIAVATRPGAASTNQSRPICPVPRIPESSPVGSQESLISAVSSSTSSSTVSREPSPPEIIRHVPADDQHLPGANQPETHRSQPLTWEDISQNNHEEMVQEISELLHRRLVSTTLDGEFRGVLEVQMQNRLATSEIQGDNVAEFVRSLPHHQHIRNDFSHLGLQAPPQLDDNLDNISVTSISATAVPYTQSNLHLSREIRSLKSQVEDMKSMLHLSFDLQLDIQRAIRQEVAAAISQAMGAGAQGSSTIPSTPQSHPINDTHCLICLDNFTDSVLYQCGHLCVCYACGKNLISRGAKCPVCRAPIRDVIRTYRCCDD